MSDKPFEGLVDTAFGTRHAWFDEYGQLMKEERQEIEGRDMGVDLGIDFGLGKNWMAGLDDGASGRTPQMRELVGTVQPEAVGQYFQNGLIKGMAQSVRRSYIEAKDFYDGTA